MARSLGKIGEAFVELNVKADALQAQFTAAQRTARNSANRMARSIDSVDSRLARAGQTAAFFGRTLAALGTTAVVAALANVVTSAARTGDEIAKTADKVGVGVEALQELRFAAERSGVGTRTLDLALQRFSRRVGEAVQGGGELEKVTTQYGIALKNADGSVRSNVDILGDLADVIGRTESEQEQLRIAFKAFDSEGAALVNLLRLGSNGMDDLRARARELGNVMSEETARAAEEAQDAITDFNNAVGALGQIIAASGLPKLTTFLQLLTDITQIGVDKFTKDVEDFSLRTLRFELSDAKTEVEDLEDRIARFQSGSRGPGQEGRIALLNEELEKAKGRVAELRALIEQKAPPIEAAPLEVGGITPGGVETADTGLSPKEIALTQTRIDELVASLQRQREIAGLTDAQQIALGESLDRLGIAFETSGGKVRILSDEFENLDKLSDELGKRVEILNAEEVQETQTRIDDMIASLVRQRDVAGLTNTAQIALAETLGRLGVDFEVAGGKVKILSDEFKNLEELAKRVSEIDALENPLEIQGPDLSGELRRGQAVIDSRREVQGPDLSGELRRGDEVAEKYREIERAAEQAQQASERFGQAVADSLGDAILGAESFKDALENILETLARIILEQALLQPLAGATAQGTQGFFANVFSSFAGGSTARAAQGAVVSGASISGGRPGVITGRQITRFASGGIMTGEAGSELVVPMSPSRIGPFLNALGAQGNGGGGADVQVIDQRGSQAPPVEVRESNKGGRRQIQAIVREEVNSALGSGAADGIMGTRFGLRTQPGRIRG